MSCIRSGRRWFVTCAGLFAVGPFMWLLTTYNWLSVKYTAYGYKIVSRQFYAINQKD
nr:MAG TPA: hypothetical protein [Caudoviricetes sp.]